MAKLSTLLRLSLCAAFLLLIPVVVLAQTPVDTVQVNPSSTGKLRGGFVTRLVMRCSGGAFSQACFRHFMRGNGQAMELSEAVFRDIVVNATEIENTRQEIPLGDGRKGTVAEVNLYRSKTYAKALGRALIFYDADSVAKGFYDKYDFNRKRFGKRPLKYELMTRCANIFGRIYGGKGFEIRYGLGSNQSSKEYLVLQPFVQ